MSWREQAACRGMGPNLFYPTPVLNPHTAVHVERAYNQTALDICGRCPVADACAEAGRREPGIWGGLLERERDPKRARARVRAAAKRQLARAS